MKIGETFATPIQKRIEPVVKVTQRNPAVLADELTTLVVTPQWEHYLHTVLDAYAEAAESEQEEGIGIWVSGFFGSGKSLFVKVLGTLLQGGEIGGRNAHDLFLERLPQDSADRANLSRYLQICERKMSTSPVGGNIFAMQGASQDPLSLLVWKLFGDFRSYTQHWPLAWAIEYQIDRRGSTEEFRRRAEELSGERWENLRTDPTFYVESLYAAAADVLRDHFKEGVASVTSAVAGVEQARIDARQLVERLREWAATQDAGGKRHKILLQLDEMGQWLASGNPHERTMQVEALVEEAGVAGAGRIWVAITAHGDIQELKQNIQQELYAKIISRFPHQFKLSNEDINEVVEQRVLRKTQEGRVTLCDLFNKRSGEMADLGSLENPDRVYPIPDAESFALHYPYMPWLITAIPSIVAGIAQAIGRADALTGATRTMIGVVQGGIIETSGLLESAVGRMLSLADLYPQLADDVPVETKTDLNQVRQSVRDAGALTEQVARALYLLGRAQHVPCTLGNITRAVISDPSMNLAALRAQVKLELDRLVAAGYVKLVGEVYVFLSTQQRTFQDRVRSRQDELQARSYELSQALKEYESIDAFRFDRVPLQGQEIPFRLRIDERMVRNPSSPVSIEVSSPFQQMLDSDLRDDSYLRQRSVDRPNDVFFRLGDEPGLPSALSLAMATREAADRLIADNPTGGPEVEVARQAKAKDLPEYEGVVRALLSQSIRTGTIFFRGTQYHIEGGQNTGEAVRNTLGQLVQQIYPRATELPRRIINEESAVKAALAGNTTNIDLAALGVYRADGTVNLSGPLLSSLKAELPVMQQGAQAVAATELQRHFERPPYGWDPNAVKVGVALLLRESLCSLIHDGRTLTNPEDRDVLTCLTKVRSFESLRVQGTETAGPSMDELKSIRTAVEQIFGERCSLVQAALHEALGRGLQQMEERANDVENWASAAGCPLPQAFATGHSLAQELLSFASAGARLGRFHAESERLNAYRETLEQLERFRREHGEQYREISTFFNRVLNASSLPQAVTGFISDWRRVTHDRDVTDPTRWPELVEAYHAARRALTEGVERLRSQVQAALETLSRTLPDRVAEANVPAEGRAEQLTTLEAPFQALRERFSPDLDFFDLNQLEGDLATARLRLDMEIMRIRAENAAKPSVREGTFRLYDLVPRGEITEQTLDEFLRQLRTALEEKLTTQDSITIE